LSGNRSIKLHANVVIKAGATQWLTGTGFRVRIGAAPDPKLDEGFGFVRCAEGDGYLKAATLP
jgi:hypothetical protein